MEKAVDYHRDIYSGIVARELGKEGYFGEEYRLYGFFYVLDGQKHIVTQWDEEKCSQQYIQLWQEGAWLSGQASCGLRAYGPHDIQSIHAELLDRLKELLSQQWDEDLTMGIHKAAQQPDDSQLQSAIRQYLTEFTAKQPIEKYAVLQMLLAEALRRKKLCKDEYEAFKTLLGRPPETPESAKTFYGFAYREGRQWHFYSNAYLPTVLEKWNSLRKSGLSCSGLVSKDYPITISRHESLREDFKRWLAEIFDPALLAILDSLLV